MQSDSEGGGASESIRGPATDGRCFEHLKIRDFGTGSRLPHDQWIVADQFDATGEDDDAPVEIIVRGPLVANSARLFFAAEVDLTP